MSAASIFVVPLLIVATLVLALIKKINPYNRFVSGCKEGLKLFLEIFPTFMAILTAVALLRACGFIDDVSNLLSDLIPNIKFYAELAPMIFFRPMSGGASLSILNDICTTSGPDSLICQTASVIQGSTDTTFYVISLYFTAIGVTKWRHALKSGLIADAFGIVIAIVLSLMVF